MGLIEWLQDRSPPIAAVRPGGRYLLRGRHLGTGRAVGEGFFDLLSVVGRASELISAGYAIDIRSQVNGRPNARHESLRTCRSSEMRKSAGQSATSARRG